MNKKQLICIIGAVLALYGYAEPVMFFTLASFGIAAALTAIAAGERVSHALIMLAAALCAGSRYLLPLYTVHMKGRCSMMIWQVHSFSADCRPYYLRAPAVSGCRSLAPWRDRANQ